MGFESFSFLMYFLPAVLLFYYIAGFSKKLQNIILFVASLVFLGWNNIRFVPVVFGCVVLNTYFGYLIEKYKNKGSTAKRILVVALLTQLSLFFVFRHLTLLLEGIIIPFGIAFITLRALSYVIDIYREKIKAEKSLINVGLYLIFFPQFVTMILKYHEVEEQICNRKHTWTKFSVGSCYFVLGLSKKVLLASNLAVITDKIFELTAAGVATATIPAMLAWVGGILFSLQIFLDLSSYSDMGIGLGLMFGFKYERNFDYPYISKSITEFWNRWYISLKAWFYEYVYEPLNHLRGGNANNMDKNLIFTWMLIGLWWGGRLSYIIWGATMACYLLVEQALGFERMEGHVAFRRIYVLLVVLMGWVFLRAENFKIGVEYLLNLFALNNNGFYSSMALMIIKEYAVFIFASVLCCMPVGRKINSLLRDERPVVARMMEFAYGLMLAVLFLLCIGALVSYNYVPFQYLQF